MKITALFVVAVSLAVGSSAFAAERDGAVAPHAQTPAPACNAIAKFRSAFPDKTTFAAATIGEFHVLKGVYLGNPKTPEGAPPGDGALIVTPPAQKGHPSLSLVAWTRNGGKDVCAGPGQILIIPPELLALIVQTPSGKDETKDPDDSKDELKL